MQSNDITVHLNHCTSETLQINLLFAPQRVDPNNMSVQYIEYYLSFPENTFPEHKGDLEEKQTVLSSISKGFLSMHISHWI